MSIDVESVLDELSQRRRERDNAVDVATVTIVAFFDDENIGEWLRPRIAHVSAKHPSRVVVIDAARSPDRTSVSESGDWIEVGAEACSPQTLASAVASLVHQGAPVALIWASFDMAGDERFAALAPQARSIVYNSSALERDENGLMALRSYAEGRPDATICDLAYLRLTPWQDAIASFFDAKNVVRELFDLRRVEIASGSDAEAYYLLGWLASRLEWNVCGPHEFRNRFGTEIAFRLERMPEPRRLQRVTLESSQTRFVAELQPGTPSSISLAVTGAVEYPQRFRPVTNIGTPALIERALAETSQDRIFFQTLLTAGSILARERGMA